MYISFGGNRVCFSSKASLHSPSHLLLSGGRAAAGEGRTGDGGKVVGFMALHSQIYSGSLSNGLIFP